MNKNQRYVIAWAAYRVAYLDRHKRYEDSYAVSQEFCEWTTCLNVYPEGLVTSTLQFPVFDKENRTINTTQSRNNSPDF